MHSTILTQPVFTFGVPNPVRLRCGTEVIFPPLNALVPIFFRMTFCHHLIYDRFFHNRLYYEYERLLVYLHVPTLMSRRNINDMLFFHRVVNGCADSPHLLSRLNFHVPARRSRSNMLFYPFTVSGIEPMSHPQALFNENLPGADIF